MGRNDDNADAHLSGIAAKRARETEVLNLRWQQMMTYNQEMIIRDDRISSRKYDKISEFSARPPELFRVSETACVYFRYCFIDSYTACEETMREGLCRDLKKCLWYDGFGRRVYIRGN